MMKTLEERPSALDSDQVAFSVTVNNLGTRPVTDIVLIEQLLEGVQLVDVDAGQPVCVKTLDTISCVLGTLNGGASARVRFLVQTTGGIDPLLGRTVVRSADLPDLSLDEPYIIKLASPAFIQANGEATWTIRLLNPSSQPATGIVITDIIPSQLEIISTAATAGTVTHRNGQVTFQLARLAPVQSATITIRTRLVQNVVPSPIITNQACLRTAQRPQQQCTQAPVFRVDQLPATGQSPWGWLRWAGIAAIIGLTGGWFLRRISNARR
jgi:uncharacterized repeat protein (TIGR01451 family)/LPXTG-motif cell wall-anchored protein